MQAPLPGIRKKSAVSASTTSAADGPHCVPASLQRRKLRFSRWGSFRPRRVPVTRRHGRARSCVAFAGRTGNLKGYRRWDAEVVYRIDLKGAVLSIPLKSLEFQCRHFQEVSAPAAVEQASIDRSRLGTIRLNLGDDKFIAYSRGSLPFDKQRDRTVRIGWEYRFN